MASTANGVVDPIIAVNPENSKGVYEVRVLRKWRVPDVLDSSKLLSVEMVLIDKHVSVNN
jgi:hypothetical protein